MNVSVITSAVSSDKCMEYAMKKWTQLSMLLAKFQNTWWSSAEASAKEEWRVLAACSDSPINWPVPCYPFQGARHDLVNNSTESYIGSDYQGIHNQQVENEKPQHIPKSWLLHVYYFCESTNA